MEDLPYDILYNISAECTIGDHHNFPVILSHTSRKLRGFALTAPALWSHVSFTKPRQKDFAWQKEWLLRSRGNVLYITIDPNRSEKYGDECRRKLTFSMKKLAAIMKLILPHAERWRSIKLMNLSFKGYQLIFDQLRFVDVPVLETMFAPIPSSSSSWRFMPFQNGAPSLHTLKVAEHVPLNRILECMTTWKSSLRHFTLCSTVSSWRVDSPSLDNNKVFAKNVLALLNQNRDIETLQIIRFLEDERIVSLIPTTILLSKLRSLDFGNQYSTHPRAPIDILSHIQAPNLAVIKPTPTVTLDSLPIFLSSIRCPELQSLEIWAYQDIRKLKMLFDLFPGLRSVKFFGSIDIQPCLECLETSLPQLDSIYFFFQSGEGQPSIEGLIPPMITARKKNPKLAAIRTLELRRAYHYLQRKDYMWLTKNVPNFSTDFVPLDPNIRRARRRFRKSRRARRKPELVVVVEEKEDSNGAVEPSETATS